MYTGRVHKTENPEKNFGCCELQPSSAAPLHLRSHQGCTLLSFSTWLCMCLGSSCLTNCCVEKKVLQPLQRHLTVCRLGLLWSPTRCCLRCSAMPKIREQFCHQQRKFFIKLSFTALTLPS